MDLNNLAKGDANQILQPEAIPSDLSSTYLVNINFKLPDGTHKSVTRTDRLLGKGGQG